MPLAARERIAVRPLQKRRHSIIERVLILARLERPRDRSPFRITDEFSHLVAEGALAEYREPLPQVADAAAGTSVLGAERIEIAEQVLIDQRGQAIELQERILEWSCRQQQFPGILRRPADALPDLAA